MKATLQPAENPATATPVQRVGTPVKTIVDNRQQAVIQRKLQDLLESNPRQGAQRAAGVAINTSPRQVAQQRVALQLQAQPNRTGLPDKLKAGIENLSGHSLDDVQVHYNSAKPAQLQAHAYAQGTNIHLAPGQEKQLPHEAWHVVQQKQGRVKPTMQMRGVGVNNDSALEKEADVMGERATLHADYATANSASIKRHNTPVAQLKVSHFTPVPDTNVETIRGVLKSKNLDKIYSLPDIGLRVGTTALARAKSASAEIGNKNPSKRVTSGDYTDVGALGRWERLAVSHDVSKKTIDTGHLIADEFFDANQKSEAYEAANLAPQNAQFNEEAYRALVERPIVADLNSGADVKLKVTLAYGSPLQLSIKTLLEKGALVKKQESKWTTAQNTLHNSNLSTNASLIVPTRMPITWVSEVTPSLPKSSKLSLAPSFVSEGVTPSDGKRSNLTPKVPFTGREQANTSKKRKAEFTQGHPFADPGAIKNPAKIGADKESGNYTGRQTKRAKKTVVNANKYKIMVQVKEFLFNGNGMKNNKHITDQERMIIYFKVSESIDAANDDIKFSDVEKLIRSLLVKQKNINKKQANSFEIDGALSEDEDYSNARMDFGL